MNITIRTIPHKDQRYPTCGDWQFDRKGNLLVTISDMGDWKHELLVAVHELVEVSLCKDRGISQRKVDNFDRKFEEMREKYPEIVGDREPGDDESAPYFREHRFSTVIEEMLAEKLGVDWESYEKSVSGL